MADSVRERLFDAVITLVLSPLIVFYWNGTWILLDLYLLPSNHKKAAFASLGIGNILMITSFFTQDILNRNITTKNTMVFVIVSRLVTYIMSAALVLNWRGVWYLMDIYTGVSLYSGWISLLVAVISSLLLRSFRNVLAPPALWVLDIGTESHFTIVSRFRTQKGTISHLADVIFGVFVLSTLVVVVWRGTWMLLTYIPTPYSKVWKGVILTSAATIGLIIIVILQHPARKLSSHLHSTSIMKLIVFEDVCLIVVCLNTITYWVGMWSLLDAMCEGYSPYLTRWVIHVVGFGGLMLFRLCTTLQFKGYFIDGEFAKGLGLVQTATYYSAFVMTSSNVKQDLEEALPKDISVTYDETLALSEEKDDASIQADF